ncbi:bifunctional 5,10-methylenetetrahydrofolate dehydrogenase/5,10-methenyltetrahydrofolate cyclohydrolase [Acidaminococcus sp. NSJ-142]|jgi:methylenetetrahydrofolate dehydrogenase (NADP+)/methenyltetrahydrofolate cyclohydrolase|uniref:bifunctional 5,10-methylenetetrahydrofolate dehydrogenase/5,10-methenyltetrahydrofolate cyclohydrolase n=1 Tax=Acidaminococcus TaxID=904 RepID=UPI000CF8C214|nr:MULTISPECIES: bifunctional 5,10-methylenetetrahydrofolate dehydrogenase/5,10-methenyltetrahydrofolate cyclohydrolase [Acidaminococcus]MCD2435771.1 bifunctional 5,10-methylenetetrahydrofolate dehydrogenase/5,10-methenyltetrahydrofolate cyclohydrolase [Acidaminococcus hominis]MCH4096486.1 bifunctional 5,10-methylenetetrahydrofolate dehydrogenase/5,10-methenyltetrahydrofolate cyclohydrolase [Acidaminococcus provencensis]RHK02838.1 bifunctional 5,10-methylenetetrahydrofolate dehydrogenase/5,10-me
MAQILSGKEVAAQLTAHLTEEVEKLKQQGIVPKLALVRIGEHLSDVRYEKSAKNRCAKIGIATESYVLPPEASQDQLVAVIRQINNDASIHGCLIFRPFPPSFDDAYVRSCLDPRKDVDGITDTSLSGLFTGSFTGFTPCTAAACMHILDTYRIPVTGKDVVVIGASLVIGRPVAMEFLKREATVSICHIKTKDVKHYCQQADIIVAAAGHAGLVTRDMVKPGQVIIDVGINATPQGTLCGDVDFAAVSPVVAAITPVPGGVGSVTTSVLASHVIRAAQLQTQK